MANDPGVFDPSSAGSAPAGVGTNTAGSASATAPEPNVDIYLPEKFSSNRDAPVPGLYNQSPMNPLPAMSRDNVLGIPPGGQEVKNPFVQSLSMQTAMRKFMQLGVKNPRAVEEMQAMLVQSGYLSANSVVPGQLSTGDATYDAYANALNDAILTKTPLPQLLSMRVQQGAAVNPVSTSSETVTATDLTNTADAQAAANNESDQLLGQDATTGQQAQFATELQDYEKANPGTETETVTKNKATGKESRSETTDEPISASGIDLMADNEIKANQGKTYAASQGAQIYSLFASLIGGE